MHKKRAFLPPCEGSNNIFSAFFLSITNNFETLFVNLEPSFRHNESKHE